MPDEIERYREALETATEPLWVLNDGTEFEVVNGAVLELTGYAREELLGASPGSLLAEEDQPWTHRLLYESDPGTIEEWNGQIYSKNGTEIPVNWHCRLVDLGDENAIVGRFVDRRQRRQSEGQLNVLNRVLRHNIRNQVNIILGKASLLQGVDDEGYRTAAEKIEEIAEEIISTSDKARRAQQHVGAPPDEECRTDLVDVAAQAVRGFQITEPAATVRTDLPQKAPARAPPGVDVAVEELLENATVHNPADEPEIELEIDAGEELTHLRIKDGCEPIPSEVRETIGRGSEQPLHHNDGLGLWIVQWTVDAVDGSLSFARREDDSGNVVTLTFETLEAELVRAKRQVPEPSEEIR